MQVGAFGEPVGLGQGEAAEGLFQVDPTAYAGFYAAFDLVDGFLVDGPVFLGEGGQFAVAQYVEIGAGGFVGYFVSGAEQFEVAGGAGKAEALDVVAGGKAVEQDLPQL